MAIRIPVDGNVGGYYTSNNQSPNNLTTLSPIHIDCFTAKMQVLLANDTTKKISDCVVGELILSIESITKKKKTSLITDVIRKEVNQFIIINGILEITESHFLYTHGFQPCHASDLRLGDYIYTKEKELEQIIKLELVEGKTIVYNIVLDNNNDICIENFLVGSCRVNEDNGGLRKTCNLPVIPGTIYD